MVEEVEERIKALEERIEELHDRLSEHQIKNEIAFRLINKALENRTNELEEDIESINRVLDKSIEVYASFAENSKNSMSSLESAIAVTSEKVNTMYNIMKGY